MTPTTSSQLLQFVPQHDIDGSAGSEQLVRAPTDASPAISADNAAQTARSQVPTGTVVETVLVNYTNHVSPSPPTALAWAVNFDPSTVPPVLPGGCMENCPRNDQVRNEYYYVLVDANTGAVIQSASVSYAVTDTPSPEP